MERNVVTYHSLLPQWAQDKLREASKVENTTRNPRKRDEAVDNAVRVIYKRLPSYFRKEALEAFV